MPLLIRDAAVVTPNPDTARWPLRGPDQGDVRVSRADVLMDGDTIRSVGEKLPEPAGAEVIDAAGRILTPGLIDCHTHACWAGDRLDEWERKLAGATYLEILNAGGGIMSTVRAVRAAGPADLTASLLANLHRMLASGTTTAEVKSGYGLTREAELAMLRAIRAAAGRWPGTIVPTALLGHALDPEQPDIPGRTIRETLPAVHREFPGVAVDAFCEKGAWSHADCTGLLAAARDLGHPLRIHADQFTPMGMVESAIALGAVSVDHLEASTPETLRTLAASRTIGVGLPACGLHVDDRYAGLGDLVKLGGAAAIASNLNPGSAPCWSLTTIMGLAVRKSGLSWRESLTACTANAACVLGLRDRGALAAGLRADAVLWECRDPRELAYWIGGPPIAAVIAGGAANRAFAFAGRPSAATGIW